MINKLVTVVMVRWVEEMGGVREKKEKKEEKGLGIGEEGKEVIKKIGSNGKIRRRKKKKGKLW
ncbi:TPA: hypothetical protein ACX6PN_003587 [Photobacterium damselae]